MPAAWIVDVESLEGRAPVLQHADQPPVGQRHAHIVLEDEGETGAVDGRLGDEMILVQDQRSLDRHLDFLAAAPDTAFNKGYIRGTGHYQLFVDNILDLSHTDFLHPDTLGGGSITRTPGEVEERPDGIIAMSWRPMNEVPIPLALGRLPPGVDRVDIWTEVEWSAPGVIKLVAGAVPTGAPREQGGNSINVHIFTPETASTSHYFFASTRDFRLDDAALNEETRRTRQHIFETEDEPMIAAQQERIGDADFWSLRPALLKIDKGAVLVRRRMDALIAAETEAA